MLLCCPPAGLRVKQPARGSAPFPGGLHGDPKATYGVTRHRQPPTLPAGSPPCPAEERALRTAPSAPAWVAASPTAGGPPPLPGTPRGRAGGPTGSAAPAVPGSRTAAFTPVPDGGTKSAGGNTCWNPPQDRTHTAGPPPSFLQRGGPGPPIPPARTLLGRLRAPRGTLTECTERWNKPPLSALHTRRWRGPARRGPPLSIPAAAGRVPGVPIQTRGTVALSPAVTPLGHRAGTGATFPAPPARPRCSGAGWPWVHWEGQTGGARAKGTGLTPCHAFGGSHGCCTTPAGAMPTDPKKVGTATERGTIAGRGGGSGEGERSCQRPRRQTPISSADPWRMGQERGRRDPNFPQSPISRIWRQHRGDTRVPPPSRHRLPLGWRGAGAAAPPPAQRMCRRNFLPLPALRPPCPRGEPWEAGKES